MTLISHTMCMAYGSLLTILEHTLVVVVVAGVITIILIKIKIKKTHHDSFLIQCSWHIYGSLLTILEHTVVAVGVITIILMTIVLISTSSQNKTKAHFFKMPIPTSQCMVIQYHKVYQASSTKRHSISLEEAYSLQSLRSLTTVLL